MSAAPEVSFPDPAEAIAKTDQAIAQSGGRQVAERHLRVVSDLLAPQTTPLPASTHAILKREAAAPTMEIPAILDDPIADSALVSGLADAAITDLSVPTLTEVAVGVSDVPASMATSAAAVETEDSARAGTKIRYRNFILTGVIIGIVAAAILIVGLPGDAISGQWAAFGYLSVFFGVVCGILGGLVAVLTDRKRVQR